jgi:hypothetical protein
LVRLMMGEISDRLVHKNAKHSKIPQHLPVRADLLTA